jgi:hypothetical protein
MNVRKFNATGDGVTDDRPAIQMAIDATIAAGGGVVFFPAGDYVVGKTPLPAAQASFFIDRVTVPLVFAGEGATSIIRMAPGPLGPGENWAMFRVFASENISFHHLLLHGNRRNLTPPPEGTQIHCMLLEQAVDVMVQNVEFREAVDGGIRVEGELGSESRRLTIVENLFVDCSSGITVHGSTAPIEDVVIQGNIVRHTSPDEVPKLLAVVLDNTQRVQFVANTILGGQVWGFDIQDFVISNNIIVQGAELEGAGLRLVGGALHGAVTGNIIRAELTSTSTGIGVLSRDRQSPEKIRLSQNTILAGQTGINLGGQDISVSDNVIESYLRSPEVGSPGEVGINVGRTGDGALGDAIQVRNNHIRDFQDGIRAVGNAGDLTRLVVVGNQIRGLKPRPGRGGNSHQLSGPGGDGAWEQVAPGETTRLLDLASGLYIMTAAGFAGNGSPQGVVAAEVGSLYTRLDGTPSLWVKETGTGPTGWVSK